LYWESSSISPILDDSGTMTHFLAIKVDISERKQAEEKIAELNRDFLNFLSNTSDFIYFKDINGCFRFCSQTVAEITGYESWKDLIGKNDQDVFPAEMARIYKDEEIQIFADGKPLLNKIDPYINAAGNEGWVSTNKWPLLNDNGKVVGLYGISRDITELRKSQEELKKYSTELKTSNADLENFAYIASHDLQEPLRMVTGFLKLLEKKLAGLLDETTTQYIHFATDGAERMKLLINALLQYSRIGENKAAFSVTNLDEMLEYLVQLLRNDIDEKKAVIQLNPLPVINANETLITDMFLNLLSNALKYCEDKEPVVEVGFTDDNDHYTFYVKDNGIGISPAYFDSIFIIFKRLHSKDEYKGTGIGLALCKKIVEIHHGNIWVQSEEGKGSTFYFTIPK
jgi:PAS domain S-box-containing protein